MAKLLLLASLIHACFETAWANLIQRKIRTFVAVCGICLAIFLLFLQLGFLEAARRAATQPYEFFRFDFALVSAEYQFLASAPTFDRIRLTQLSTTPGIADTFNLNIRSMRWINPETEIRSSLLLFGIDNKPEFVKDNIVRQGLQQLKDDRSILADTYSDPDYGDQRIGDKAEINDQMVTIAGTYALGPFFYADGSAIIRNNGFSRLSGRSSRNISVGLVRLETGFDPIAVKGTISELLPDDVVILTRGELFEQEQNYFVETKPVGLMFHIGAIIAFVVGVVILFQVLSTEVTNRLREYATMKAIGFGSRFVYAQGVILTSLFTIFSFVPAIFISYFVFAMVRDASHLPMTMSQPLVALVLSITFGIAITSGIITLHRVRRADPAELY